LFQKGVGTPTGSSYDNASNSMKAMAWSLCQSPSSFHQIASRQKGDAIFGQHELDCETLQENIARDVEKGALPCVVFAKFSDDLESLKQICDKHSLWLHVEGDSTDLLLASAGNVPTSIEKALQYADSITCRPVEWFYAKATQSHLGSSVCLTFMISDDAPSIGMPTTNFCHVLPLWCQLQDLKAAEIRDTADMCLKLCDSLRTGLNSEPELFECVMSDERFSPSVVHFQILPKFNVADLNLDRNDFNLFLLSTIEAVSCSIDFLSIEYNPDGSFFSFRPVNLINLYDVTSANIDAFVEEITAVVVVLQDALTLREYFKEQISQISDLQWVEPSAVQSFVGLGSFQLLPQVMVNSSDKDAVMQLNLDLSRAIAINILPFLSLSQTAPGNPVIVIGAAEGLSKKEDIDDLVTMIQEEIANLELPDVVIEKMGAVILEGIKSAERHIEGANASDYHPDNLVRAVPLFGSIYSWIVPTTTEDEMKMGQSFDITTGSLQQVSINESAVKSPKAEVSTPQTAV